MAFKTKAQIFGDNGANGAAVPVSTTNPAGTAAANRGIGFGEPLTSAIANRTTYALADNDEDLNTRLARFETEGLDAAYDSDGTPGSGRVINLDAGAVELQTVADTGDEAGAQLRHLLAESHAQTGADVVGPGYAFVHRIATEFAGNTVIGLGISAVLNPGGAGGNIIGGLSGGNRFADTGTTDLIPGVDLIAVTGAGAASGVYRLASVDSDTQVSVVRLDPPGAPSFTSNTACTIRVYRINLTVGNATPYGVDGNIALGGMILRKPDADDSIKVIETWQGRLADNPAFSVSATGRTTVVHDSTNKAALELQALEAAMYVKAVSQRGDGAATPVVSVEAPKFRMSNDVSVAGQSIVFLDTQFFEVESAYTGSPPANSVALPAPIATVNGTASIVFAADATTTLRNIFRTGQLVRLETLTGTLTSGFYFVHAVEADNGNGRLQLRGTDGSTPTFGTATATLHLYLSEFHTIAAGAAITSTSFNPAGSLGAIVDSTKSIGLARHTVGDQIHLGSLAVVSPYTGADDASNLHRMMLRFLVAADSTYTDKLWSAFAHLLRTQLGERYADTAANAMIPRLYGSSGATGARYTLMFELELPGTGHVRFYTASATAATVGRGLLITTNAVFDATTNLWSKDTTGAVSIAFGLGDVWGFITLLRASGAGTWSDLQNPSTGWNRTLYVDPSVATTAMDALQVDGASLLSGLVTATVGVATGAAPGTPAVNRLYGDVSGCKAFGRVDVTGSGSAAFLGTPFNFSSVTLTNSSQDLNFLFDVAAPMADANYDVKPTLVGDYLSIIAVPHLVAMSQTGFTLRLRATDGVTIGNTSWFSTVGALSSPIVGGLTVSVHGRQ